MIIAGQRIRYVLNGKYLSLRKIIDLSGLSRFRADEIIRLKRNIGFEALEDASGTSDDSVFGTT